MQNNDKQRYYPLRDPENPTKITLISITEEQYHSLYPEIWRIRNREQNHGCCMCPKCYLWKCDSQCDLCEYHADSKVISLNKRISTTNDNDLTLLDVLSNFSIDTGDFVTDALVFKQLLKRLDELIPNAKEIGKLRLDGFSDKAIAHKLGIPRTTMLSQLKKALNKIIQEYPDLIKF